MARYQWVYKDKRYLKARAIVMQRDNGVCQNCMAAPGTECHHKIPLDDVTADRSNPDIFICFSPDNMEMLCDDCHKRVNTETCADDVIITADGEILPRNSPPGGARKTAKKGAQGYNNKTEREFSMRRGG